MPQRASSHSDRHHPHRLPENAYREVGRICVLTVCARPSRELTTPDVARVFTVACGRVAKRRHVRIHAYCIMPDHLHVAASVCREGGDLRLWARYMKREVARSLAASGMWQRSFWDRQIDECEDAVAAAMYILENPVRAGLCERVSEWRFSWSEWYEGCMGDDPNM